MHSACNNFFLKSLLVAPPNNVPCPSAWNKGLYRILCIQISKQTQTCVFIQSRYALVRPLGRALAPWLLALQVSIKSAVGMHFFSPIENSEKDQEKILVLIYFFRRTSFESCVVYDQKEISEIIKTKNKGLLLFGKILFFFLKIPRTNNRDVC